MLNFVSELLVNIHPALIDDIWYSGRITIRLNVRPNSYIAEELIPSLQSYNKNEVDIYPSAAVANMTCIDIRKDYYQ
jgi:hypothetical protein